MDAQGTVTDSQRVVYALGRLNRWAENYDTNAARAMLDGRAKAAQELTIRASTTRDIIKMLDGSDDFYILSLRSSSTVSDLEEVDSDS